MRYCSNGNKWSLCVGWLAGDLFQEEVDCMIKEADVNGDGNVDFQGERRTKAAGDFIMEYSLLIVLRQWSWRETWDGIFRSLNKLT